VAFEDLYWMQKVSIILAIVVVDSVIVAEFIISTPTSTRYVGSEVVYFGGWKKFLYFMTGV